MFLLRVYHFTECCVYCNGVNCLWSSVHRTATVCVAYFGINYILMKNERKTKSISLFP